MVDCVCVCLFVYSPPQKKGSLCCRKFMLPEFKLTSSNDRLQLKAKKLNDQVLSTLLGERFVTTETIKSMRSVSMSVMLS